MGEWLWVMPQPEYISSAASRRHRVQLEEKARDIQEKQAVRGDPLGVVDEQGEKVHLVGRDRGFKGHPEWRRSFRLPSF